LHIFLIYSIVQKKYIEQINDTVNHHFHFDEYFLKQIHHDDVIFQANHTMEYYHTKLYKNI